MTRNLIISFIVTFISTQLSIGQTWQSTFENKADFLRYVSDDEKYVIGTTKKDICVLDGKSGQKLWCNDFRSIADVKSCENQYFLNEAGVLFLSDKRMGKDNIFCIDISNGNLLWKSDQYEGVRISDIVYFEPLNAFAIVTKSGLVALNARTGEMMWEQKRFVGSLALWQYLSDSNDLVLMNFKTGWGALFSGYQNQLMKVDAMTGEVKWETEYFGVVHAKFLSGVLIGDMTIQQDRIFCFVNGMQVFDLASGEKIWRAEMDMYDYKLGLGSETYVYEGVAQPYITDEHVYLVNFKHASKKVFLEKRNIINGEVIWNTKLESNPDAVPMIAEAEGKIFLQLGGRVNIQGKDNEGRGFIKNKWVAPFKVQAYDAANGHLVWESEKLNNRITNILMKNNTVFVADKKSLYGLNADNGSVTAEYKLTCGEAKDIHLLNGHIGIIGEKGFSLVDESGAEEYFIKMKEPYDNSYCIGDNFLIINDDEYRVFSVTTGKEKMLYKKDKNCRYSMAKNGSYIFTLSPKVVERYDLN